MIGVQGLLNGSEFSILMKRINTMGEVRINLTNFISVGLMAFVGVWLINKGLGMSPTTAKYKA